MSVGGCCTEGRCRRRQPYRIRRGALSGRWYLITRWRVRGSGLSSGPVVEALERHDITDELIAALLGWPR
jgi:hypothetical protein